MISPEEAQEMLASADELYSKNEVEQTLDRLAQEITDQLGKENPVILCVLNGALIPT